MLNRGIYCSRRFGLALFPDHEVQLAAWLSDSHATVAQEFDLVIVDAAALRATNTFEQSTRPCGAIVEGPDRYGSTIPRARQAPARDKLVVLTGPIQKETCNQL